MNAVRTSIEATYKDICCVMERKKTKENGVVRQEEVMTLEAQPCRLSFMSINAAGKTDTAAPVNQTIKLFLAPEIEIKSGTKIIVEHCGRTNIYAKSGIPAVYATHQEIILEEFKEWA